MRKVACIVCGKRHAQCDGGCGDPGVRNVETPSCFLNIRTQPSPDSAELLVDGENDALLSNQVFESFAASSTPTVKLLPQHQLGLRLERDDKLLAIQGLSVA